MNRIRGGNSFKSNKNHPIIINTTKHTDKQPRYYCAKEKGITFVTAKKLTK